jgi:hypothetical protein
MLARGRFGAAVRAKKTTLMNGGSDISTRKYLFLLGYGNPGNVKVLQFIHTHLHVNGGKVRMSHTEQRFAASNWKSVAALAGVA